MAATIGLVHAPPTAAGPGVIAVATLLTRRPIASEIPWAQAIAQARVPREIPARPAHPVAEAVRRLQARTGARQRGRTRPGRVDAVTRPPAEIRAQALPSRRCQRSNPTSRRHVRREMAASAQDQLVNKTNE